MLFSAVMPAADRLTGDNRAKLEARFGQFVYTVYVNAVNGLTINQFYRSKTCPRREKCRKCLQLPFWANGKDWESGIKEQCSAAAAQISPG